MSKKPIRTVRDLMAYLGSCPLDAEVILMPEEGDGFLIGGVLEMPLNSGSREVWILIDEFSEVDDSNLSDWVAEPLGGGVDDDIIEEGVERRGDMATAIILLEEPKEDVVKPRGKLRSA